VGKFSPLLSDLFKNLESRKSLSETEVSDEIGKEIRKLQDGGQEPSIEMRADWAAFAFMADSPEDRSSWGTYFGPLATWKADDGRLVESPSREFITEEILRYWDDLLPAVAHPVLRARYADLLWDFAKPTKQAPQIRHAQAAIDAYLDAVRSKRYEHAVTAITYARRALQLSISTNDGGRIEQARDTIIQLERDIRQLDQLGTWGFAFDLLIENKKSLVTDQQRQNLIADQEQILQIVVDSDNFERYDPFIAESAALRLAAYYRRINRLEDSQRILVAYARVFVAASDKVAPLQAHGWLRRVYDVLQEYGMRAAAEELAVRTGEVGKKTHSEMETFQHEFKIPEAEVEKLIDALTAGSLDEILARIAIHFAPDRDRVEKQIKELAEVAPLTAWIPMSIVDSEGRSVANIGPVESDLEGRIVIQMSQNLSFEGLFLRQAIERALRKHEPTVDLIVEYLFRSPLFLNQRKSVIAKGIQAYLDANWMTAAHLLIPQIEEAFRQLLVLTNRPVFKPGRHGGLHLRSLDDMLTDSVVIHAFTEKKTTYLRVLLTDPRGWNLRNNLCHGILEPDGFGSGFADRILHVFLLLGLIRHKEEDPKREAS
jgi:hypothetical protein